jgi:predicted AAA+ superfamily ATPase
MIDSAFLPHNLHIETTDLFARADPHLRRLSGLRHVHTSPIIGQLPAREPGIYTLGGGRQVGKTTLLKQWMLHLLRGGLPSAAVAFISGELIDDHHALVRIVTQILSGFPVDQVSCLVLDEVTYIRDWDKGVKFLADAGMLGRTVLVLSGSDLGFVKDARTRFPGRRGKADVADFHLQPLSFRESLQVKGTLDAAQWQAVAAGQSTESTTEALFHAFDEYLAHGGYMTALNDLASQGRILPATYATYSDWIRGDMRKRGKNEQALRELLGALIRQYGSQVTWHSLSSATGIEHHATMADYVDLLGRMEALLVVPALVEHRLAAAPKKARKVFFSDPFVRHSIRAWLEPGADPFGAVTCSAIADPQQAAALVDSVVAAHYGRHYPLYYIKAEGEVDVAYVEKGRFCPVEVKWTTQMRPADLRQVRQYPNALILTKARTPGRLEGIPTQPVPLALAQL